MPHALESERASPPERRLGLSPTGILTVSAVGAVLVLVSLPRLRGFALHENELDALAATRLIVSALAAREPGAPPPSLFSLIEGSDLSRRLPDAEFLEEGRLLRRHGYLFELLHGGTPLLAASPGTVQAAALPPAHPVVLVRAWPWQHGRTGTTVLLGLPDGRVFGHPNERGRWSGPERPPPPALGGARWLPLP